MTRVAPSHSPTPAPDPAPGTAPDAGAPGSDDADGTDGTAAFAALLSGPGRALLDSLGTGHRAEDEIALVTRLRRDHPAELVSAALAQAALRRRAVAKFGAEDAARMFFTADGVEQATRAGVARRRAERFAALGVRRVADLCCGIGGDALALARAGIRVLAVDRSPLACAAARANAEALGLSELVEVRQADVTTTGLDDCDALFVDPARRAGGSRRFDPEAYSPPLSWALATARSMPVAALKTGPGIDHQDIPADVEAEWVSDGGAVKEAVLWFGTGDAGRYRATLLPAGDTLLAAGLPNPPAGAPGRYLYEPDGAVIRAHAVADVAREVGGRLLDPAIAYVTADTLTPTRYADAYEITDVLPFGLKRLKALLRERSIGNLTIKKRGFAMTPEELRSKLRLDSRRHKGAATLFLTRADGAPLMLLGHPVSGPASGG
ncbi:class I SAM-dependent methyltransferase [Streptomyces sp. SM12]|uniref:class I SAM-dependent methyltransferase n=1 Tax=Streptomyces sp. SM12 TaxID=1071602 RepID=UPI000CD5287E